MLELIRNAYQEIRNNNPINRETAQQLSICPDQQTLCSVADEIRCHFMGDHFHLCSIINARSGNCTEDCRFCAQSARYQTGVATYTSIDPELAMEIAMDNENHGVHRLSLVTSGHSVDKKTLAELETLYQKINQQTSMDLCASMGFLDRNLAEHLTSMGVSRYHCNLEASEKRFPEICSSHTWQDKVKTLKIARLAGMSLCSGGIAGMGETMEERIDLAFELRQLGIRSIPVNILTPIPGTPLADLKPLPLQEVLTTIALFRFINPDAVIRMAGGRQQLGSDQYRCFAAGANGAIVGNYLTTRGSSIADDLKELQAMGFSFNTRE